MLMSNLSHLIILIYSKLRCPCYLYIILNYIVFVKLVSPLIFLLYFALQAFFILCGILSLSIYKKLNIKHLRTKNGYYKRTEPPQIERGEAGETHQSLFHIAKIIIFYLEKFLGKNSGKLP